jgi:hypothetical protein
MASREKQRELMQFLGIESKIVLAAVGAGGA